jgi:gliding motility-associated-like protein
LNKGETYSFTKPGTAASDNPVGTIVESSQPIAITIKDDSVINGVCRDLLGDQLIPVEVTGMEYIVVKGFLTTAEYFFITATENDTHIFMEGNNVSVATLDAGQSRPFNIGPSSMYIRSDKRIYVVHVTGFGCEMGMTVLPPINCTGSRQIGFTRSSSEFFGLNILVKKEGISHFKLNGSTTLIPPHVFKPVIGTNSTWYTAQLSFDDIQVPVDQSSLIENEKHSFQAGLINGNAITSARYGYFSSFSTLFIGDDFAFCDGATAIIDAGPGKESYLWSTGETTQSISVDATGDYWVKVVREDCELYDTIRINERIGKVDLGPDVLLCEGDTAVVDGKENFSWAWSDGSSEQFLKTTQLGKHWVSVFDDSGCEASDTIMIGRLIYNFAEGIDVKLKFVSVDTTDDKNIELSWSVSELERNETNSVSIYKRIAGSTAWVLAAQLPATIEEYQDVGSNSTDDNVYEYYVSLANPCGEEQRFSDVHNTVRLQGSGDAQTNLITLNWNYYQLWALGVDRYEIWRKLETEREYKLFSTINGDGYDFFAPIATDAFHHDYIIRSIESGADAESWSNSIQFDFEHPVYVPNVFTPNDDAYNETFEITNIQLYHNSKLLVIDRWGVIVYETDGYLGDWNGGNVSSGVYYYILYLNRSDLQPLKGTLSIIK